MFYFGAKICLVQIVYLSKKLLSEYETTKKIFKFCFKYRVILSKLSRQDHNKDILNSYTNLCNDYKRQQTVFSILPLVLVTQRYSDIWRRIQSINESSLINSLKFVLGGIKNICGTEYFLKKTYVCNIFVHQTY